MLPRHTFIFLALVSFLILTTIGFAQVNYPTLSLFPIIRQIAIIFCGVTLVAAMLNNRIKIEHLISISFLILMYSVALLQSGQLFFQQVGLQGLSVAFTITVTGAVLLSLIDSHQKLHSIGVLFQAYATIVLVFIYITGGISLYPMPSFNFDLVNDSGSILMYNQGVSKFFALAAIFSLSSCLKNRALASRLISILFFGAFTILSFIGGGRGDFAMLLAVCLLIISMSGLKKIIYSLLIGALALVSLAFSIFDVLSETTAFIRIQVILQGDSLGMRDVLFFEAYRLLINEPRCLIFGCGFAFFQEYYGYSYGLYPHNILLESFITWGAIFMIPFIFLFAIGLSKSRRSLGILFWVGIYFVGIGFKSGDVINSWFAMSFVIYVSALGMKKLLFRDDAERRINA